MISVFLIPLSPSVGDITTNSFSAVSYNFASGLTKQSCLNCCELRDTIGLKLTLTIAIFFDPSKSENR